MPAFPHPQQSRSISRRQTWGKRSYEWTAGPTTLRGDGAARRALGHRLPRRDREVDALARAEELYADESIAACAWCARISAATATPSRRRSWSACARRAKASRRCVSPPRPTRRLVRDARRFLWAVEPLCDRRGCCAIFSTAIRSPRPSCCTIIAGSSCSTIRTTLMPQGDPAHGRAPGASSAASTRRVCTDLIDNSSTRHRARRATPSPRARRRSSARAACPRSPKRSTSASRIRSSRLLAALRRRAAPSRI